MKKVFTFLSLCLSFFFFSCNIFSTNDIYSSIVINFGSLNHSRAAYTIDDLSYCVVSIEPKVQDDIKVDLANGETKAVFRNLVKGTYKINVSAFDENNTKIANGESEQVEVKPYRRNSVKITMKFLSTDYSDCVVGDFILKDGTILSKDKTPESGKVAAVIVRAASGDTPALGVGIFHNKDGLPWCTDDAVGLNTNIAELVGTIEDGYMDGSDGWQILKGACSDAEAHPDYYPAWNYSLTYAENNDLTEYMAEGWYLPTLAELYTIHDNLGTIDASLERAGGNQFDYGYYWSCSQSITNDYNVMAWDFDYGEADDSAHKSDSGVSGYYVCTVKAFN